MKNFKVMGSLFVAAFLCMSTMSCGNKTAKNVAATDSTVVSDSDSTSVDSVSVDSAVAASIVVK